MESVIDTVTDAIADASDLVLDSFSSAPDVVIAGKRGLRRGLLVVLLLGVVIGIAFWRRSQASKAEDAAAPDRS
jgi:hypothetical protein